MIEEEVRVIALIESSDPDSAVESCSENITFARKQVKERARGQGGPEKKQNRKTETKKKKPIHQHIVFDHREQLAKKTVNKNSKRLFDFRTTTYP